MASIARRLAGFRYVIEAPPTQDRLPRMDVPVFVGFAASGPINVPVAVDDTAQFAAIFGEDAPLAWDAERSQQAYAHLAPSVRAFFRNGGKRCWVVRVAAARCAQSGLFPVPGLAHARVDASGRVVSMAPALARARSEGQWSDSLTVAASLLSQTFAVRSVSLDRPAVRVIAVGQGKFQPGDLLRLTYPDDGLIVLLVAETVSAITPEEHGSPPDADVPGQRLRIDSAQALWFEQVTPGSPPEIAPQARLFSDSQKGRVVPILRVEPPGSAGAAGANTAEGRPISLTLAVDLRAAPRPGSYLCAADGDRQLWMFVDTVEVGEAGSPPEPVTRVSGPALWSLVSTPAGTDSLGTPVAERLTFQLVTRRELSELASLADLGFAPGHPRFWGDLPSDETLFGLLRDEVHAPLSDLWRAALAPRFPLAGGTPDPGMSFPLASDGSEHGFSFPLLMPVLLTDYSPPLPPEKPALCRDGLGRFDAGMFLDARLAGSTSRDLMAAADHIFLEGGHLDGIHAALEIDEATLLAVPDAGWAGWAPQLSLSSPPDPVDPLPSARPEWWHYLDCDPPPKLKPVEQPVWNGFLGCDIRVIPAPVLDTPADPDPNGTFTLTWSWSDSLSVVDEQYIVEEATSSEFADSREVYRGSDMQLTLYGRPVGNYYCHVRVEVGGQTSDWSKGVVVPVRQHSPWKLNPTTAVSDWPLITVHRALLRLCAARGDLFTVMSLPAHYREDSVLSYPERLQHGQSVAAPPPSLDACGCAFEEPPLSLPLFGEPGVLSYGAAYHPWLTYFEEGHLDTLRVIPPDGAIAGIMAQRAARRGAWIAPANQPINGPVALTPPIPRRAYRGLLETQVNLIRQEAHGFVVLSADTLSQVEDLRPINVRRLLCLLRRLALREGAAYVFEPLNEVFQRAVQRGFEALLNGLFIRGAFAGASPANAYQVNLRSTPTDLDRGLFIVELRVAPSRPMSFMTIRVIQSGDRGLVLEEP